MGSGLTVDDVLEVIFQLLRFLQSGYLLEHDMMELAVFFND